jgi:hypothetical protein
MYISRGKKIFLTKPTGRPRTDPELRFTSRVDFNGPDECWEFLGSLNPQGYGKFTIGKKDVRAHRYAYELTFGDIPDGMVLLHSCDNPPCCNPAHLSPGTVADNAADMCSKGRKPLGSISGTSKLTESAIVDIRERLARGETQASIAAAHGVTQANISYIKLNLGWKHVP